MLDRPTTTLQAKGKRDAGSVDFDDYFPPRYVRIEIDLNAGDMVEFTIHELIHVTISELVLGKFDETLEEVMVVALTDYIFGWVKQSPTRLAKWRTLIDKKMREHDAANTEPIPYEERVDRSTP